MSISRVINLVFIVVGGLVAFYAQAEANQNVYILIGGIALLMTGIYRTSRNIPSKFENEDDNQTEV